MTAIVVDASVAVAWRLREDEGALYADAVIHKLADREGIVPSLFWAEIVNILVVAERRGRISATGSKQHLGQLGKLGLNSDHTQNHGEVLALARRHSLSGYDAFYLETVKRRGAKLATLDKKLADAADAEGVTLDV